jgi:hypothetical protein
MVPDGKQDLFDRMSSRLDETDTARRFPRDQRKKTSVTSTKQGMSTAPL